MIICAANLRYVQMYVCMYEHECICMAEMLMKYEVKPSV